jgi:RHS repeat-associated protein
VLTDSSGNFKGQRAHFPFGETWYETGTTSKLKFTSYERDSETGNDFAMARYHVNRLGRFSSVDPVSGSTSSPQSFNRYAYVSNDPVNFGDPSGLFQEALQEVIAAAEGTNGPNGYGLLVYGTVTSTPEAFKSIVGMTFSPNSPFTIDNPSALGGHPGIQVGSTSAFGRYQIERRTAANYGFTDFSPRGQDNAPETLMGVRNMVVPAMDGDLTKALTNGNPEWTSLPGGSQEN